MVRHVQFAVIPCRACLGEAEHVRELSLYDSPQLPSFGKEGFVDCVFVPSVGCCWQLTIEFSS